MLKKQYKGFLAVFILLLVSGALLCLRFTHSYDTPSVSSYSFVLNETQTPPLENIPLMFSFEDGTSVLYCHSDIRESLDQVLFRYPYGTADNMSLDEFAYQDSMNGTILMQGQTKDGSIKISAKSQPRITQSYDAYAWDTHTFADASIPVEICYAGSGAASTNLLVFVYGIPYTGEIHLQTLAGKDEIREITDGALSGLRIQDLRKGTAVTVTDKETGQSLIGTYVVEDYPIFSIRQIPALYNFFLLILLIAAGCTLICAMRCCIRKKHRNTDNAPFSKRYRP